MRLRWIAIVSVLLSAITVELIRNLDKAWWFVVGASAPYCVEKGAEAPTTNPTLYNASTRFGITTEACLNLKSTTLGSGFHAVWAYEGVGGWEVA